MDVQPEDAGEALQVGAGRGLPLAPDLDPCFKQYLSHIYSIFITNIYYSHIYHRKYILYFDMMPF